MTAKKYLSQIGRINRMIRNRAAEIAELEDMAMSVQSGWQDVVVKSAGNSDKIGAVVVKISELQDDIVRLTEEYTQTRNTIVTQIENIDDNGMYDVLFKRYVLEKSWEDITKEMHYSFKQVSRIHGKALQEFSRKYLENTEICP